MDDSWRLPSVERLAYVLTGDLRERDMPLWEVVWTLNAAAPDAPLDEKIRLARRVVSQVVGDEHELWRGEWPDGPVARLTEAEKRQVADDDAAWHDPRHASMLVWICQIA